MGQRGGSSRFPELLRPRSALGAECLVWGGETGSSSLGLGWGHSSQHCLKAPCAGLSSVRPNREGLTQERALTRDRRVMGNISVLVGELYAIGTCAP